MNEPQARHEMVCETQTPTETLFVCETCGRRVVLGKLQPRLTVIDRGDFWALHSGSTVPGVELSTTIGESPESMQKALDDGLLHPIADDDPMLQPSYRLTVSDDVVEVKSRDVVYGVVV